MGRTTLTPISYPDSGNNLTLEQLDLGVGQGVCVCGACGVRCVWCGSSSGFEGQSPRGFGAGLRWCLLVGTGSLQH